jgi:hypothetical protein
MRSVLVTVALLMSSAPSSTAQDVTSFRIENKSCAYWLATREQYLESFA